MVGYETDTPQPEGAAREAVQVSPAEKPRGDRAGPGRPRRTPRQERARLTVAAILEAAAELFATLGYAGATTNKIAARAGVSIGSLYQYFPDKLALITALRETHLREVHTVIERAHILLADPDHPLAEGLRSLLDGLLALHAENPGLNRVLGERPDRSSRCEADHDRDVDRYGRQVAAILKARPEVQVTDPVVASSIVVRTVESITRWLVHEAPDEVDRQAVVDDTIVMLLRYLTP